MPDHTPWREERPTQAFLVAFDISGFSRDPSPDSLLRHRQAFFQAVENTQFYKAYSSKDTVRVHFLGDELRLAVPATLPAGEVRDFARAVLRSLRERAASELSAAPTEVRGVILAGTVVWRRWHDSEFLFGELPLRAQDWMSYLESNEVAIDAQFRQYLDVAGLAIELEERMIGEERAFTLRLS